jgi:demethoxyubiquinone hydroxylase (CLK1/Coq7/Cat5 family)
MKELIEMLKRAHAIEIGAYHAYLGHYRNVKDPFESAQIQAIRIDESGHRKEVAWMLSELGAKPNRFYDAILWCIGKTISAGCYVFGYRMAMWGAKVMEVLGSEVYENLAAQAILDEKMWMVGKFAHMAQTEKEHEEFFNTWPL